MTDARAEGPETEPQAGDPAVAAAAFNAMPFLMSALEGPELRLVAANRAWRTFSQVAVAGQRTVDMMPDLEGQQLIELLLQVHRSGEPFVAHEWRVQFLDGHGEVVEAFVDFTVTPWRWPDGTPRGVLTSQQVVTDRVLERRAAEQRVAQAERRYAEVRDVVTELQAALLPSALPVLPRAGLAARYLVAAHDQAAGGDWFDAVPRPDGTVAAVVGDVVGHGVGASATMGQVRAVLRSMLATGAGLLRVLARLEQVVARDREMRGTTVAVAILDAEGGGLTYATRGHPAPLVVAADGTARYLEATGGGPLGTGTVVEVATETLQPGEVLVLYTDGLVERAAEPLTSGLELLRRVVGDAVADRIFPAGSPASAADRVCEQAVDLLTRTGYDDDVTLLALERLRVPRRPLSVVLPSDPTALARVRELVDGWLAEFGLEVGQHRALRVVIDELVANCVEHAYPPPRAGSVRVDGALGDDGVLTLRVSDDGRWVSPDGPPGTSGRGLWIASSLVDELHVDRDASGTTVTVRHRLSHPAVLASETASSSGPAVARAPYEASVGAGEPRVLTVAGPLDPVTAPRFADDLALASRGGVFPVTVDLRAVQLLTSACVRVLFDARDAHAALGHEFVLVAVPGGLAAQVLDLVGLPYQA